MTATLHPQMITPSVLKYEGRPSPARLDSSNDEMEIIDICVYRGDTSNRNPLIFVVFFENSEKSRVIKYFPLNGILIFLKILKNWNVIFRMRRFRASGYN